MITLVGLGFVPQNDCTLEALARIKSVGLTITFDPTNMIGPFLRQLGVRVVG